MGDTKRRKAGGGEPPKKRTRRKTDPLLTLKTPPGGQLDLSDPLSLEIPRNLYTEAMKALFSNPDLSDESALALYFGALNEDQKALLKNCRKTVYTAAIAAFEKKTILEKSKKASKKGNSSGARASTPNATKEIPNDICCGALKTLVSYGDNLNNKARVFYFEKLNKEQRDFLIYNHPGLYNKITTAIKNTERSSKRAKSRSV